MTEPTRCIGRSERHALQQAHRRYPSGFEIVGWKRVGTGLRRPVEVAVRPIQRTASRERARLRLLACVNAVQGQRQAESRVDPGSIRLDARLPAPGGREVWACLGGPGSGVTRMVCGLASRLHGRDRCTVGLLSGGDEAHATALRPFADAMGLPMQAAASAAAMQEAAASMGHRSLVIVDLPGVGLRDTDRHQAHARALQALAPQCVLAVLPADLDEVAMRRQIELFSSLGATHAALTRLDLAARVDHALRALATGGLQLAWVAKGASALGDLEPASRPWLDRVSDPRMALT